MARRRRKDLQVPVSTENVAETFARNGFVFPVDVMGEADAGAVRADLERAESELADDPERLMLARSYADRLLPSFDRMIRSPNLIDAVRPILGPDLLVWSCGLFIKEARSTQIVTWHQDLTYWGLDDVDEVTAWVALSPSTVASGCMRFIPGSHRRGTVAHVDTFDENNLLTRGQEIAVAPDDGDGVDVILRAGQTSLHHGHLFHSSGANTTADRRLGAAIRYIKPSMRQRTGDRSLVAHVSGVDEFGHFRIAGPPRGWLSDEDFALCREDSAIKRKILYENADPGRGQRY